MLKTSFEYELSQPIKYTEKGDFTEGQLLVFYAPSVKEMRHAQKLKAHFFAAIDSFEKQSADIQVSSKKSKEEAPKMDATFFLIALEKGSKDLEGVYATFLELICSPVCKVEDKKDLTRAVAEQINLLDLENILAQYLDHFLLQSFKKMMSGN